MKKWLFIFTLTAGCALVYADGPARQAAVLDRDYKGTHGDTFNSYFDRVRLLVQQAQLEASSRLGLFLYREGFQYPLTVRFQDGAPAGLESALAYVQYAGTGTAAGFQQELVVNMDELAKNPMDFDTVFYHEMTHAVMNDAVGGIAVLGIPHWVQEGLAMYVSGEGDGRVKAAAEHLHRSQVHELVFPLTTPPSGIVYPQYYLAIKYMLDKYSVNAVQALVRNLTTGKSMDIAIYEATGLTRPQFAQNVQEYSQAAFENIAIPDGVVTPSRIRSKLMNF